MEINLDANFAKNQSVIFLHVPKTAGSSLTHALVWNYRTNQTFVVHDAKRHRREVYKEFTMRPEQQRKKIKLLKGHFPFGAHNDLPMPSVYMTMLRNPIDRLISHYYYVLRSPKHYLYDEVKKNNMSLEDYIQSGITPELDNGQVRQLSGVDHSIAIGSMTETHLELAVSNINKYFAVVGLTERFDESLLYAKKALSWSFYPFYQRKNVTQNRPLPADIKDDTLDLIKTYNALDCKLYDLAEAAFDRAIQKHVSSRELNTFRRLRTVYEQCAPALRRVYTSLKLKPINYKKPKHMT